MLKENNKGFSLIEVLVANSILLVLLVTFIPIYTTITYEQAVLKNRLMITSALHDELQPIIWQVADMENYSKRINKQSVAFSFMLEDQYIKGCANWLNKQDREEEVCLYGLGKK